MQAQDRFWQMDAWRHITAGRLSELVGKDALDVDKFTRTMGWRRVAARELELLDRSTVANLEAFSRGVTEYLRTHGQADLSLEYSLLSTRGLRYEPDGLEPDRLAGLAQGDGVGPARQHARRAEPRDPLLAVQPRSRSPTSTRPTRTTSIVPVVNEGRLVADTWQQQPSTPGLLARPAAAAALDRTARVMGSLPELVGRGDGIGSNAWVVGGAHSTDR